jgi:hypothetical protein
VPNFLPSISPLKTFGQAVNGACGMGKVDKRRLGEVKVGGQIESDRLVHFARRAFRLVMPLGGISLLGPDDRSDPAFT